MSTTVIAVVHYPHWWLANDDAGLGMLTVTLGPYTITLYALIVVGNAVSVAVRHDKIVT